jgi:hypothetical protein
MNRTLRPAIQMALEIITMVLTIMLVSINDFSIEALPIVLLAVAVVGFNLHVLERYGRV